MVSCFLDEGVKAFGKGRSMGFNLNGTGLVETELTRCQFCCSGSVVSQYKAG